MSNIIYYDHPIYVNEAFTVLSLIANGESLAIKDCNFIRDECDYTLFNNIFSQLESITDYQSLHLFKVIDASKASIASLLFYTFFDSYELDKPDIQIQLIHKNEEFLHSKVNDLVIDYGFQIEQGDNYNVTDCILNLNINAQTKVELLQVLNHPNKAIESIFNDMNKVVPILKQLYEHYNNSSYLSYFDANGINQMLNQLIHNVSTDYVVIPSVVSADSVRVTIKDENVNENPIVINAGILVDLNKITDYDFFDDTEERLEYFSKVIADKSKMKILMLLKQQPMYGAQLAKAMNLKTPTISHHIDTLFNAGIISATKENNKVLYTYNKQQCLKILDYLKSKLS